MTKQKYEKTKYPNIWTYETKKGTLYRIRKSYVLNGEKKIIDESKFKTLASVKARLRELEEHIDKNEIGYLQTQLTTVQDYYEIYSKKKLGSRIWTKDSKKGNDSLFKNHIFPFFGKTPLLKLDRNKYELHLSKLLKSKRRRTVQSVHIGFMAMLNDAVYAGVMPRNRLQRVVIGKSNIEARNKRISLEEYKKWIATAEKILSKYEFSMVYMAIFGLRRGEINGIRKKDISFDSRNKANLHIQETRTNAEPNGKGSTKTAKSNRYVTLDSKGSTLLKYALKEATEIKKDYNEILHQDDFIFINESMNAPFYVSHLNRLFSLISKESEIKISPHMLRHNFATQAVIAGIPLEHTAEYLGHSNKVMTEQYTHIKNETSASVINIMEEILSSEN